MSGNLWMFSDMLDDEDIEMQKHDFITLYQGADYYGLGLKSFTRMAREAGAVYKIGKKVLIRRTIFDEYLRKIYKKEMEQKALDDAEKTLVMRQGAMVTDEESGRMDIRFGLMDYYGGLHCGECLDVLIDGEWIHTRIEMGDAVVQGGQRMGAGGTIGFVGRAFGGMAARNGAQLTGDSIASVAGRAPNVSGMIAGDIADRSLANYMPHISGMTVSGTEISGGQITAKVVGADGKETSVAMYSAAQFEKPDGPHSVVTASDGSQWYQMASGPGAGAFYDAPQFSGSTAEAAQVAATFPDAAEGTTLRTVGDGVIEASHDGHNTMWYNSAYYDEPDAPHTVMTAANGVDWYAMNQHADSPQFEAGDEAYAYNQAYFQQFMPGFDQPISPVDGSQRFDGHFEVRHEDGSGTMFYDTTQFAPPRGDYQVFEDVNGSQWYAIHGEAAVDRRPVFENGKPVYDGDNVRTVNVDTVRYKATPSRYGEPEARNDGETKAPKRKR